MIIICLPLPIGPNLIAVEDICSRNLAKAKNPPGIGMVPASSI